MPLQSADPKILQHRLCFYRHLCQITILISKQPVCQKLIHLKTCIKAIRPYHHPPLVILLQLIHVLFAKRSFRQTKLKTSTKDQFIQWQVYSNPIYKCTQTFLLQSAGGASHICEVCNRGFANSQYLRDHRKVHTNHKPFVCDFESCGKSFRLGKDLKRHKRTHTGEKPFRYRQLIDTTQNQN